MESPVEGNEEENSCRIVLLLCLDLGPVMELMLEIQDWQRQQKHTNKAKNKHKLQKQQRQQQHQIKKKKINKMKNNNKER